jgi:DNA modification methylase
MHPFVKQIAPVSDAIKNCFWRNRLILDPFVGSGTALIATEPTGRKARAFEIDPSHVEVAIKR